MSLQLRLVPPVPEDTARVARAAFPEGNPYLRLRDELGTIFHDADFADLYPLAGAARARALAAGPGHHPPVPRGPLRPTGRRRRPRPDRLEVPARAGADRPGVRRLRALRVPLPPARRRCRGTAAGEAPGPVQDPGPAQGPGPAAHRLDPRAGPRPRHQPARVCDRDAAPCPEQPGGRRPGLAPRPQLPGMGRAIRPAHGRIPDSRPQPGGASGLRLPARRGRPRAAGGGLRLRRAGVARGGARRRDPAAGVGPAVRSSTPGGCGGGTEADGVPPARLFISSPL